jgi:hypothetical protein
MVDGSIRDELKVNSSRNLRKIMVERANNQCSVSDRRFQFVDSPQISQMNADCEVT